MMMVPRGRMVRLTIAMAIMTDIENDNKKLHQRIDMLESQIALILADVK